MTAPRWSWLAVPLVTAGWMPLPTESVRPDEGWTEEFFLRLPEDMRGNLHHLAVTRDDHGAITRVVIYLGRPSEVVRPNPWLAAGFSLALPGAGQAYAGDWQRGAMFLGTAVLLWGIAWGLRDSNPTLGNALGIGLLGISIAAPLDAYLKAKSCDVP